MEWLLLPVYPVHVENIFTGIKKYEYRKTRCRRRISGILIYATAPTMKIVGEAEVIDIMEGTPQFVWEQTCHDAGITERYFSQYFFGRQTAVAYALGKVKKYQIPVNLYELGIRRSPQSYLYVTR